MKLRFPWPDKALSPNARVPRMTRASAVRVARSAAYYTARAALPLGKKWSETCHLRLEFCPPDRRRRDADNLLASAKACIDGLADAMGVDDHGFTLTIVRGQPEKGGAVYITITEEGE